MGTAKAELEWHGSTLLRRTLGVLDRSLEGPLLVVRSPGQPLPEIPPHVHVVDDPEQGRGPLQGIAAGLAALAGRTHTAFICSTDLPFLHPAFVRRVLTALTDDIDVVLPVVHGYPQPLAAAYRITIASRVAALLAAGELRLNLLFGQCATRRVDEATLLADPVLATADPALDSLVNVNTPAEYHAARRRLAPQITVARSGANEHSGPRTIRAGTLAGAAAAVGLALHSRLITTLNGEVIGHDVGVPLVTGDTVAFDCAAAGGCTPMT